jgi:putative membrane protein (TIGR04086 family)
MAREVVVRPAGTSWGAIIDGWLATVGVAAILTPIIAFMLTNLYSTRGYASAVPILAGVGLSYLIGGYVAGRMAGDRGSWHGMMVAFLGLFIVCALLIVDLAFAVGMFGAPARLIQILPLVLGVAFYQSVETFAFGGVLGLLIAVFAAWLGGLLAPARIAVATVPAVGAPDPRSPAVLDRAVSATPVHSSRGRFRLLPSTGRKGGERVDEVDAVKPVESTDRIEPS